MAGLKVVATNTVANRDILASENLGTLCRDNPTSLFLALVEEMSKESIRISDDFVIKNSWEYIVRNYFDVVVG